MHVSTLRHRLRSLGANPAHEQHVLRRWAQARPQDSGRRRIEHYLPRALRDALPALTDELAGLARLQSEHLGADGSSRLLVALADGQTVEAVLLPPGGARKKNHGLCVSTQVGCAVGCVFCKTGEGGLARQLGSAEIVAQVALARTRRAIVDKVVFMGMGEPAHNLDAVMEAVDLLGREGGIGHKQIVLSSVGDVRLFERLLALPTGAVRPALALSLHSTVEPRRAALLPRAPRIAIASMVELAERHARAGGYPIQYQWALLEGVNDGDDEVEGLAALLRGRYAMLNLIPYNAVEGFGHRRPSHERCVAMTRELNRRGILTRLRWSAGQDVQGGCGQLRSRRIAVAASSRAAG